MFKPIQCLLLTSVINQNESKHHFVLIIKPWMQRPDWPSGYNSRSQSAFAKYCFSVQITTVKYIVLFLYSQVMK